MKQPSAKALSLILEYEVGGGESYYNKYLKQITWPGGASGPTLGIGIDCGYYTPQEIEHMFNFLQSKQLDALKMSSGKTGQAGKAYTQELKKYNISVTWDQAVQIFDDVTWPKFARLAESAFPELDKLCDNAYGALVSLVFNRGTSMSGSSRSEMRNIRELVPKKDYQGIADNLRNMKRIWEGKGLDGLLERRDAEAACGVSGHDLGRSPLRHDAVRLGQRASARTAMEGIPAHLPRSRRAIRADSLRQSARRKQPARPQI